ncbi:MAG: right-handed parallel beta-helix repeat-containing protein [Ferruginibacter sp.]
MRVTFLSLLCFIVSTVNAATTYYVSSISGNDNNNGSITTPWKSIAKVNSFTGYVEGDAIAFKCGEGFYGSITVKMNNLTFKSYGTGVKPLISGLTLMKPVWTNEGQVYTTSVPTASNNLLVVYVNGIPMEMGRYPNSSAANGGYLTYESSSAVTSITDNNPGINIPLIDGIPADWANAEICVRKDDWTLERNKIAGISDYSGSGPVTYTFTRGGTINPEGIGNLREGHAGYGYFIQNARSTLDTHGEWYFYAPTKRLSIFLASPPANYVIQAATQDVLLDIGSFDNITIQDLVFAGANRNAIASDGNTSGDPCTNITISNCDFTNIGARAINLFRTNYAVVQNCTFNWCLSNAVQVYYPAPSYFASNCTITGCTFNNIAPYNGMGCFFDAGDFNAVHSGNHNALVQYNDIQNTGKAGILWQGNNVTISKNFLNNTVKHFNDNGAIYTYATNSFTFSNRTIENNIILNALGQPNGTNSPEVKVTGIYLDGKTMEVNVTNNTVAYSGKNGIHCNNPYHVNLVGNTLYDNVNAIGFMRWKGTNVPNGLNIDIPVMNINANNNICYSRNAAHRNIYYTNAGLNTTPVETMTAALSGIGIFNYNYYGHVNQVPFELLMYNAVGSSVIIPTAPMSLSGWNGASTQDALSTRIKQLQSYSITSSGTNLFSNPEFDLGTNPVVNGDITGLSTYNAQASLDNTTQVNGTARSFKVDLSTTGAPGYSLSVSKNLGLAAGTYVLSFKTRGINNGDKNNIIRASLRSGTNTDDRITEEQIHSFSDNTGTLYHEFVFFNVPGVSAKFAINVEKTAGIKYIDEVKFMQVTASQIPPDVRFEYNKTQTPQLIPLDGNYVDAKNIPYNNNSITLQPYTSAILFKASSQLAMRPMTTTSVNPVAEEVIGKKVSCYPNPVAGALTIDNLDLNDGWESVTITSFDGKNTGIVSKASATKKLSIDLNGLVAGKYFAVLTNKKGNTKILSFIKL